MAVIVDSGWRVVRVKGKKKRKNKYEKLLHFNACFYVFHRNYGSYKRLKIALNKNDFE